MSKEVKNVENVKEEKVTVSPTHVVKHKRISPEESLLKAVKENKSFPLVRSVYQSKRNGRYYYAYNVFLILPGARKSFVEIVLKPDNGFIGKTKNKDIIETQRNRMSYRLINFAYDTGKGLELELRAEVKVDKLEKQYIDFTYVGVCSDDNGEVIEIDLIPDTPGADGFLKSAFRGFGGIRSFAEEDFKDLPELATAFANVLMPGEVPAESVEDDIE